MDQSPCACCGHPDAAQREREAILDRWLAGESLNCLAWDYGTERGNRTAEVEAKLRQAVQERMGPSLTLCLMPEPWWRRGITARLAWLMGK